MILDSTAFFVEHKIILVPTGLTISEFLDCSKTKLSADTMMFILPAQDLLIFMIRFPQIVWFGFLE